MHTTRKSKSALHATREETSARNVVSFELPLDMLKALKDDAVSRGTTSHHKRAREIIVQFLSNRDVGELHEEVAELDRSVSYLGELMRRVAYSVIVHAGNKPSETANEWIRDHMPRNP